MIEIIENDIENINGIETALRVENMGSFFPLNPFRLSFGKQMVNE